jgi:tetraacyldisaccharide 4'-kinase
MPKLADIWYGRSAWVWLLLPLSALYCAIVAARRLAYRTGLQKIHRLDVPVIVVGNLTVGGTGKTPLAIWLSQFLRAQGYRPGLIARGYGGKATHWPQAVTADSDPSLVGDEPVLLVRATDCPMVVAPDRVAAARALLAEHDCNIIISDDGLQHYALGRDIEIAVVDGERRFGNAHCLPAGPLREPARRLREVDLIVANGAARAGEFAMRVHAGEAVNLLSGERRQLHEFHPRSVRAIAGIGHPERFFAALRAAGLKFTARAFPDHHDYRPEDLASADDVVIMTEKDAVKCRHFARDTFWAVETRTEIGSEFGARLVELLRSRGGR